MKRNLLFTLALLCASYFTHAQSVLFSEDFETGGGGFTMNTPDLNSASGMTGINRWIVNNAYTGGNGDVICLGFPFTYNIVSTNPQPAGITNSPNSFYMHTIGDEAEIDNILCSSFTASDGICFFPENNFSQMANDISTVGLSGVELSFWWACAGGSITYGEVYFSTDGGTTWTILTSPIAQYNNQPNWTQQIITNPAFDNQSTLRFGFRFVNQSSPSVLDPGFSIDDVNIYTACTSTTSTITESACDSYTVPSGNATYTASGTYMDTIPNASGCDSVITINLTVDTVDTGVTVSGVTITANQSGAGVTYQWINCNAGNAIIPGETGQSYTATINGNYAVIINNNGCIDTSACPPITTVGIDQLLLKEQMALSPNPASNEVQLTFGQLLPDARIEVLGLNGQLLLHQRVQNSAQVMMDVSNLADGMYILRLIAEEQSVHFRLVKE